MAGMGPILGLASASLSQCVHPSDPSSTSHMSHMSYLVLFADGCDGTLQ